MQPFIEEDDDLVVSTSCTLQNQEVEEYIGIISSNVTMGRNVGKDVMAGLRDFFGGRSRSWEKSLQKGQRQAIRELLDKAKAENADGLVALTLEDEAVGAGNMMNIKATATAVRLE
ncbi:MAG: YbjQ family protein [Candidatus Nanohaloarchaea archaeon]